MKKFVLCALLIGLLTAFAAPVFAWDESKTQDLGRDDKNMQWWLLEYGTDANGAIYAVVRKYYTNAKIKNETIELLMGKGISPEVANSLYFTEYGYEYTKDGKQFALTYLRHHDRLGGEIRATIYDDSSDDTKKTFQGITGIPAKVAKILRSKKVIASASSEMNEIAQETTASAGASSTIPANRIVRAKKSSS